MRKLAIINRAVPGTGKTSISQCIVDSLNKHGISHATHSTDAFFMTSDNRYVFDGSKLHEYHQRNQQAFCASLQAGVSVVICDNINILPWQTEVYTQAARTHGYTIVFMNYYPRALEKHIQSQQSQRVTAGKPDAHGVSESLLVRFIEDHATYNDLLDRTTAPDAQRHCQYRWNQQSCMRETTGCISTHFDGDVLIEMHPQDYHAFKQDIGERICQLVHAESIEEQRM